MPRKNVSASPATPGDPGTSRRSSRRPNVTPTPTRKPAKPRPSAVHNASGALESAAAPAGKSPRASKATAAKVEKVDATPTVSTKADAKSTGKRGRGNEWSHDNKKAKVKQRLAKEEEDIVERLRALASMNSLQTTGEGIDTTNDKGETYLHFAAYNAEPQLVKWLVEKGADCNMQDQHGKTPLSRCASGDDHCVKTLLQAGADVDLADKEGISPLHYASLSCSEENVNLMLQYEAHVNTFDKTNGSSPLHDACFAGSLKCVKALVEAGAHVDMKTKSSKDKNKGAVALHYAAQQDRHEIVEYLIRQNASVNIQDARGCTPLHYAAYTGSVSVVRVLLKHKADPAKEDAQGRTAEKLLDISPILKIPGSNPASPRVQIMQLLKPASKTAKQNACTIC